MNSVISIVVPIYKIPNQYLINCIKSLINQTYHNLEIILVDDGSPDNCGKICDEFAQKDNRIKVVHKQNGGLSSARNSGVENATGKWLMFVDGDDWIEPKTCEILCDAAESNSVQMVIFGLYRDYGNNSIPFKYYIKEKLYINEECKWLQEQLLHFNGNITTVNAKLVLRDLIINENIFHDPFIKHGVEGLEYNLRLFDKINSAIFINKLLYHYTYNKESISSIPDENTNKFIISALEKIKNSLENSENKENLLYWFYNRILYIIITTVISGFFNPDNDEPYKIKKKKCKSFLSNSMIVEALKLNNNDDLSFQRKFILFLINNKLFFLLNIIGIIRRRQKANR